MGLKAAVSKASLKLQYILFYCLSVSSLIGLEIDMSGFINLVPTQEKIELDEVGEGATASDICYLHIDKATDKTAEQIEPIESTWTLLYFLL